MQVPERGEPTRADWWQAGLVGLVLLGLYAASAPRTVALEDDGLFILSSYFLGVEHPPGYPLYTMAAHAFGRLVTWMPVGWALLGAEDALWGQGDPMAMLRPHHDLVIGRRTDADAWTWGLAVFSLLLAGLTLGLVFAAGRRVGGSAWAEPEKLLYTTDNTRRGVWGVGEPTLTGDGEWLYFVAIFADGQGGFDADVARVRRVEAPR